MTLRSEVPDEEMVPANGEFDNALDKIRRSVWYDAPNPVPGLYQYVHMMCSYVDLNGGNCAIGPAPTWKFEGVSTVPF